MKSVQEIDEWLSSKVYDPEDREINTLLNTGSIKKDRMVLAIGTYGILKIVPLLKNKVKKTIALDTEKKILSYVKAKAIFRGVVFKHLHFPKIDIPTSSCDAILICWSGLLKHKELNNFLKELLRVLKFNGILIIEEPNEKSDFVKLLEVLTSEKNATIKSFQKRLRKNIKKYFRLSEKRLTTYYNFKTLAEAKKYFANELRYHEKKRFTLLMEKLIKDFFHTKKNLNINEKSILFICKKPK